MKIFSLICTLWLFATAVSMAQPFTLDKDLKPRAIELKENKDGKGKIAIVNSTLENNDLFYFVKGHDLFEFIDVYVFSNFNDADFKVELVNTNWKDVKFESTTGKSEDGIVNFKLRAFDNFGIHVYPGSEAANITVAVSTTEPSKTYLTSPFRKATKEELSTSEEISNATNISNSQQSDGGSSNTWLYVALGVAGLVIALLLGIMLGRKKTAIITLLLLLSAPAAVAQQHGGNTWHDTDRYRDWLNSNRPSNNSAPTVGDAFSRLNKFEKALSKNVDQAVNLYKNAKDFYKRYEGLSSCISSTPPAGTPRIPTFCSSQECEDCFVDARTRLQKNRYTFEQLKTIYACTDNFIKTAVDFGNSLASLPGGAGLGWGPQRIKIEKSHEELRQAYDKKYVELLESQQEILMELNDCEAAHGLPDWYDRFGYVFYDFTALAYKRPN